MSRCSKPPAAATGQDNSPGDISLAVQALHTPDFFPAMIDLLRRAVPFTGAFVTTLHPDRAPTHVHDNVRAERRRVVVDDYLESAYLLDPIHDVFLSGATDCAVRLRDVAPDHFLRSTYYKLYYGNIDLRDEMALLIRMPGRSALFYSLGRIGREARFTARDLAAFRRQLPLVGSLSRKHFENRHEAQPQGLGQSITQALENFGAEVLTGREREIAALILKGHSSASIGALTGTTVGTVKIHRKNLYRKLGIGSQSELLSRFLQSVMR